MHRMGRGHLATIVYLYVCTAIATIVQSILATICTTNYAPTLT